MKTLSHNPRSAQSRSRLVSPLREDTGSLCPESTKRRPLVRYGEVMIERVKRFNSAQEAFLLTFDPQPIFPGDPDLQGTPHANSIYGTYSPRITCRRHQRETGRHVPSWTVFLILLPHLRTLP